MNSTDPIDSTATSASNDAALAPRPAHTPLPEMQRIVQFALQLIAQFLGLFPRLVTMPSETRRTSRGRFGAEEEEALRAVLSFCERWPEYFVCLADQDNGDDPSRFEIDLIRDRLERRAMLGQVSAVLAPLPARFDDTVNTIGELVRVPLLEAYKIARPLARTNTEMATVLAPALDFYGKNARAGAKTRKSKGGSVPSPSGDK